MCLWILFRVKTPLFCCKICSWSFLYPLCCSQEQNGKKILFCTETSSTKLTSTLPQDLLSLGLSLWPFSGLSTTLLSLSFSLPLAKAKSSSLAVEISPRELLFFSSDLLSLPLEEWALCFLLLLPSSEMCCLWSCLDLWTLDLVLPEESFSLSPPMYWMSLSTSLIISLRWPTT